MSDEPLIAPVQTEMRVVETPVQTATHEQPTAQQEQTADEVFSREQQQAIAALLALQMGAGLLHNCALEMSKADALPQQPLPRRRPEEEEPK